MTSDTRLTRIWRFTPLFWAVGAMTVVLITFAFWNATGDMFHRWNTMKEYGYGYLIPVITAFLVWQRRVQLAETEFRPTWWGVWVILLGGVLFFLGEVATTYTLAQYALVIVILGIALAFMGWQAFRLVMGPLALLFFMVPLPPFIFNTLSTKLQLISSSLGVAVIRAFGISVYLEGNVIDLGSYKLQVVEACSGLRYLFPLASLSFVAAYLYRVEFWKRALVFLSSAPITVLMNSFRIGVIGVLVEYGGPGQAEGFLHYFEGWVIFMACMGILFLEMALLARIGRRRRLAEVFGIDWPDPLPKGAVFRPRPVVAVHYGVVGALLVIALSAAYVRATPEVHPQRRVFAEFPLEVGPWKGRSEVLEQIYLDSLKLEDYLLNDYVGPDGKGINFYVAWYKSQHAGSAAHSPRACIPGGGWLIEDLRRVTLPGLTFHGHPVRVNRLLIAKGDTRQVVYYWFEQRGRDVTSEWLMKWYLFWDALTRHRTDGALVRLTTLLYPGEDPAAGDKRLLAFARKAIPMLGPYVPD